MKQKELSFWLKFIIVGIAVCGAIVYAAALPYLTNYLDKQEIMEAGKSLPWLITVWISAIPCYLVLIFAWKIAGNIGNNRSFSRDNAKYLKWISYTTVADVIYFFIANAVLAVLGLSQPSLLVAAVVVCFFGAAFSVCAAALSHLVIKAAEIQEENDLTV